MRVISGSARGTKLNSIESEATRPTLDRVKESLFNIIQHKIEDATVLDLFAGSGAIGIETLSRKAKLTYFCENNREAINMVYKNLQKTNLTDKAVVMNTDYKKCLQKLSDENIKFDLVYIDPPYRLNIAVDSVRTILKLDLLLMDGIIIIETDDKERELLELEKMKIIDVYDIRKYGRVSLLFLRRKE